MIKAVLLLISLFFGVFVNSVSAQTTSVVTVVNPIRGAEFWDLSNQKVEDAILGQMGILKEERVSATWLVRFDALSEDKVIQALKNSSGDEVGLLLEVTPKWAEKAGVSYHKSDVWHMAGSVFLTGYSNADRVKLIDATFSEFKEKFGYYPKSVGAWWVDSYSLDYMQKKYGVSGVLIVADQYTTDNYQIWGQYFGTPYYPTQKNTLLPAQQESEKIDVVVMQWAARDPVNGYGNGVQESTYSVQANDYIDYHDLDISYFNKLLDTYLTQDNVLNQVVVGLENTYLWSKYKDEYKKQIETVASKRQQGVQVLTMDKFASLYRQTFTKVSPTEVIFAKDPLGGDKAAVWFMNPFYRVGWFFNNDGSVFRDVRQYIGGQAEPCYEKVCEELNFATSATRVLDEVSFNQKLVVDSGQISDISVKKQGEDVVLTYKNAAGKLRTIKFLPRDIAIDDDIKTIDGFILNAVKKDDTTKIIDKDDKLFSQFKSSNFELLFSFIKFLFFMVLVLLIPGYLLMRKFEEKEGSWTFFVSLSLGLVLLALISWGAGLLKSFWLVFIVLAISILFFGIKGFYRELIFKPNFTKAGLIVVLLIVLGTFFQTLSSVRSGWVYDYGVGYYGPLGHDGVWHQALIAELTKNIPPNNTGFAGETLTNYHYFYDLVVAATAKITGIPIADLLFRFYPILFSILLGIGSYVFANLLFKNSKISIASLFFVYFGSSFGWIVDLLKKREIGGESAFWVNQPVSMNLNPPFAVSLILLLAGLLIIAKLEGKKIGFNKLIPIILLWGSLIEFKVYAGVIALGALLILAIYRLLFKKDFTYLKVFGASLVLSLVIFLPQNSQSGDLLVFSPFWFIHSMVDVSDRVGWERLSLARQAYFERGEWIKFFGAEVLALFIFIVGNLGTRVVGIVSVARLRKLSDSSVLLITLTISISFLIPIAFIQKGNPWNTIQFMYYGLFFMAFLGGSVWYFIYQRLPKALGLILVLFLVVITPISSYATFKNGFSNRPPSRVPLGELEGLEKLRQLPEGVVLTYPFNKDTYLSNEKLRNLYTEPFPLLSYETTNYVSAFANKPSFLEDEVQQIIFQTDYKKRLVEANDFFKGRSVEWSNKFLKDENISYIYLPRVFKVNLSEEKLNIKKVFENSTVEIFKVNN